MSPSYHSHRAAAPLLLASRFSGAHGLSLGISAAQAQQTLVRAIAADRGHLAHRPEPDPRQADLRRSIDLAPRRAGGCTRRTGTRPASGTGSNAHRNAPRKGAADPAAGNSPASSALRRP